MLIAGSIVAALLLLVAGGGLALAGHRVSGSSMRPTLVDGELFAVNPFDRRVARFDVVLLRSSPGAPGAQELVKRVIGLPGDQIEIAPVAGGGGPAIRVSPSGQAGPSSTGEEVYPPFGGAGWRTRIECCTRDGRTSSQPRFSRVPPGHYFVLGDNAGDSIDSRTFGWVDADAIRGLVVGRVWPPGRLPDPGYRLQPALHAR